MKKLHLIIIAFFLANAILFAQPDTCRIYIWDNDAGECRQDQPAAAMNNGDNTMFVFSDMRDGNWNIYGQMWTRFKIPYRKNFLINPYPKTNYGDQLAPDVACHMRDNVFFVVWQDSSPFWDNQNYWHIAGVKISKDGQPLSEQIKISADIPINKSAPKVAVSQPADRFVVVWEADMTPIGRGYDIYARLFDTDFVPLTSPILVNDDGTFRNQRFPDVAASDSGFVVVWQDRRNSGVPMIYGQKYDRDMNPIGGNYLISSSELYRNSYSPKVSCNSIGKYVVAWHYEDSTRILGRMGNWSGPLYDIFTVTSVTSPSKCFEPDIAMVYDSAFVFTWHLRNPFGLDLILMNYYRGYGDPYGEAVVSEANNNLARRAPCIASYSQPPSHTSTYFAIAWFDSVRSIGRGDIFGQYYRAFYSSVEPQELDSLREWGKNFRVDNLRQNGRKVWYHPKKNYDNPATPDWDEDPIAEPDSVYIPLDSAFVRAFSERNNIPNQQFFLIHDTDTLNASLIQDPGKVNIGSYDLCVMDLGYATEALSAGEISDAQMDSIEKFSDVGGALLCSGGDFGEMYGSTSLYTNYFGAHYDNPGNPYTIGNIDSLGGMPGTFAEGMKFHYPFQEEPDNSIDFISPNSTYSQIIFMNDGPAPSKWSYCRGISYSAFWKGVANSIYLPFAMGSLVSDGNYPNTQDELTRRILGFQGFNVEPSPIHDLAATSSQEGTASLSWTAPSDDALTEAATSYQLKYSWYNVTAPDLGRLSSEQDYLDSGRIYYQNWAPQTPGVTESRIIRGLPPGDTIILALKAGDETSPRRLSELGNEPRVAVYGDKVTPHTLGVGYGFGCVKDFISSERIDIRDGDTLYCTWDTGNVYFGYSRCDWRTAGDLLIYLDTRDGGSDSTYDYNSLGTKSAFDVGGDFKPDFCVVVEGALQYMLKSWNESTRSWQDSLTVLLGDHFSLDNINNYEYLEIGVPFSYIGNYDTTSHFRYLVVAQQESDNNSWNVFPILNGIGKSGKTPARYPYYYQVTNGLRSGLEPAKATSPLAVELNQFSAMLQGGGVMIYWRTESETDNYQWLIDRSTNPDFGYQRIASIAGQGTSPTGHSYQFLDTTVLPDITYYYLLGDQDLQQNITWHGPVSVYTGDLSLVSEFRAECRPNPAKGAAEIRYSLPRAGTVELSVYDVAGRLVRTFGRQWLGIGRHTTRWDCTDQAGRKVPSGVYFYRLAVDSGRVLKGKLTVIR